MLIRVPQQSERDIEAWERDARADPIVARSARHKRKVDQSIAALQEFVAAGPCYAGVSWGKDSVCVAGLIAETELRVPLIWVHREPYDNPHCASVRDAFLEQHPGVEYHEIMVHCVQAERDGELKWWALDEDTGEIDFSNRPKQVGFARLRKRFGARYVTGLRADESVGRKIRMRNHGLSSENACAPIGWWSGADVFAYLYSRELPVHPSYAMSMGGAFTRERLRVGSIGGSQGREYGRAEWEQRYYGWRLAEIRRLAGSEVP